MSKLSLSILAPFALLLVLCAPAPGAGPAPGSGDSLLPKVELINAGREPRVPLRYEFRQGLKETMEMKMDSSIKIQVERQTSPKTNLPTTYLVFSMDYEKVTEEGDLRYSFLLKEVRIEDRADLDPAAVEEVRKETQKLVGTKGWALVTPRGVTTEGETTLPEDTDAAVRRTVENLDSQLKQLSAPLPEEPIGEGGRWSVTTRHTVNGVKVDQTLVFRVLSIRDGKAVLNVKGLQGAEPQRMHLPGLPARATARLESLTGKAVGTLMLEFDSAIPRLDCDVELAMECTVQADGQQAKLKLDLGMRTGIYRSVSAKAR